MSDYIEIYGVSGFGYHGLLEHEREFGQNFSVDVKLKLKKNKASITDDITDAIDYSVISNLVHRQIVGAPVALIEHLGQRIATEILANFPVKTVEVAVHKPGAPVGVPVADVVVRLKRDEK